MEDRSHHKPPLRGGVGLRSVFSPSYMILLHLLGARVFMDMPDLVWDKVEQCMFHMAREQYDRGNEQL